MDQRRLRNKDKELTIKPFHVKSDWEPPVRPSVALETYLEEVKGQLAKGPGQRGHMVADILLPMMFLGLRKLGNIC